MYEKTPNSGGYYHATASYWANGAVDTLAGLGLPTFTYRVDGEGRPNAVTANSGTNPIPSATPVSYNVGGQVLGLTFGSGDSDSFSFDSNTNRMTQYQYSIGAAPQTVTGALTWNANGTLRQLAITDQLNSNNTQTCTYGYDDLVRITSANCGSVWSQTFGFDPFGNLSKSGSVSFQPTYDTTTNRVTTVGGQSFSYDANGNTLNDTFRTYAWDTEGHATTVGSFTATYDALGRMVEQSGTTQIVYAPTGQKFALMSGQTVSKAFVPLPGGAQAVYSGTTLAYFRHPDWLGSARFTSTASRTMYSDASYAPFGEPYPSATAIDPSFTGQNQDTVPGNAAGLYDFLYREYALYGRWISPDPAGLAAVDLTNPQSLNRYAYVMNSPTNLVDPLGLRPLCFEFFRPVFDRDRWVLGQKIGEFCIEVGDGPPTEPPEDREKNRGRGTRTPANNGLKQTVCSALPQGRVTSLNGSVGLVGGQQGSLQQVVNYNNGEVSNFFNGGLQVGWNGGASASASAGFIYKPGGQFANSDFSGPFNNISGSAPEGPGGSVSWASNGVKIVQGGVGVNLIPGPTGNYSYTWTSNPNPGGNVWTNLPSPLGLFDLAIYGLRKAAGC